MTLTHRWRTTSAALIAGLGLAACTAQPDEPIEIGSAATPATTPTLSERDQAIADAKDTYQRFIAAYDAMTRASGSQASSRELLRLVEPNSPAYKDVTDATTAYRGQKIVGYGHTAISWVRLLKEEKKSEVKLRTCLDYTAASSSAPGESKRAADTPYLEETVRFVESGGQWKIRSLDNVKPVTKC